MRKSLPLTREVLPKEAEGEKRSSSFFISPSVGLRRQLPRQREPWGEGDVGIAPYSFEKK